MADCYDVSIREFCELQTPIFMFDKDGAFVVMKLEQVSIYRLCSSFLCEALLILRFYSCFHCRLAQKPSLHQASCRLGDDRINKTYDLD
jgi:hypothetical protein